MEPKVNYVLVGGFLAFFGALLIGVVLWLGKTDYRGSYDRYHALMRESVAGLSVDSTVKYRGVDVGRVKDIALNPDAPEEVRLTLDILHGTPIKTDTIAVLETQGLTGLATLNLTGGSREAPALELQAGQEYPVIKTGPSLFFRLDMALSKLLADQGVSKLMHNLTTLSEQATGFVGEENRAALRQILNDLATVTRALAAHSDRVDQGVLRASESAENLAKLTESLNRQVPALLDRLTKSAGSLQVMTDELARTSKAVGGVVQGSRPEIEQFTRQTLAETGQLVAEMRQLTATLQQVARQLEQEPSQLILGRRAGPRGPGE